MLNTPLSLVQPGNIVWEKVDIMRRSLFHPKLFLFPFLFFFLGLDLLAQDYNSVQDGYWQSASSWDKSQDPGCSVSSDILIEDSIRCNCSPLEIKGDGNMTVEDGGELILDSDLVLKGELEVESGGILEVGGDFDIGDEGGLSMDGDATVHGDLNAGGDGDADGNGDIDIGGTGCEHWEGDGDCTDGVALPVDLLNFEARFRKERVVLQWRTANEFECDHYRIERATDAKGYRKVDETKGQGTSQHMNRYEVEDRGLPSDAKALYYRLIQVDRNGEEEVYGPVDVNLEAVRQDSLKVHPNPSDGAFFVELEGAQGEEVLVLVRNLQGKVLFSQKIRTDEGDLTEKLQLRDRLAPGLHLVNVDPSGRDLRKKVLIR